MSDAQLFSLDNVRYVRKPLQGLLTNAAFERFPCSAVLRMQRTYSIVAYMLDF